MICNFSSSGRHSMPKVLFCIVNVMKDYSQGEHIWCTSTANWNSVIQYKFIFTIQDKRRKISATQWEHSYKRFSTAARWSADTLQVSAEENWTAETLLSVYLFLIIKADDYKLLYADRGENCA